MRRIRGCFFGGLIIGGINMIFKVFELIAKFIFSVLYFFRLHLTALVSFIGILLHLLTGILDKSGDFFIVFHIIIGITLFYALISFSYSVFKNKERKPKKEKPKKVKKEKPVKVEEVKSTKIKADSVDIINVESQMKKEVTIPPPIEEKIEVVEPKKQEIKPIYYRVKQNNKYIMAEYPDRYELFYEQNDGLKYIRTDYKENYSFYKNEDFRY